MTLVAFAFAQFVQEHRAHGDVDGEYGERGDDQGQGCEEFHGYLRGQADMSYVGTLRMCHGPRSVPTGLLGPLPR
ncbi:hypothetical protein GCM10023094_23890 [Rhodococcus olei]|uniref:Uncharacterized protein n=1 Tax=Rhodococcus olei TaxID=2161675 RepID=A0ABP8P0F0_9NOCA